MKSEKQQCKYYNAPEIETMTKNNRLPKVSHVANILEGDDEANQIWNDIKNSGIIPKGINPKADTSGGEHQGTDADASNYNVEKDPDCWWTASGCVNPKHDNIPSDLDTCPEPNTYGLTFDDGPNCTHNALYDFMKEKKLKATMFYIGTYVATWPYQAQRGIADGHDVCIHTWAHRYMTTLSDEQVFAELFYTARAIKAVSGVTPTCWRPPFGDVDDRVRAIATGLGLRTILWKEDTDDWNIQPYGTSTPQKIEDNYNKIIAKGGKESPIVLAHELYNETMNMFMKKQPEISAAYKNVVPISACYNITKPYVENGMTFPTFSQFITGQGVQGLPDGNSMKIDANVKMNMTPISKASGGFGKPQQDTQQSTNGSSNAANSSTQNGQSAAAAGASSNAAGSGNGSSNPADSGNNQAAATNSPNVKNANSNSASTTVMSTGAVLMAGLASALTLL
ncbi:chitin deacetylase [Malassezia pachydermatis]|uniref:chitin deacetylase n=1 Tax=Malassezia pachydermatis TaxID=77020 RepID=A0A0M8MQW6_9BASI|nr:chitin deacetylase [Malassezia pachydermatis]KOS12504.1 chitin deacetylase [Malassezia pachydermatis]